MRLSLFLFTVFTFSGSSAFADCSEKSMSYPSFLQILEREDVQDLPSFLRALPRDSMSNVTLVHSSLSLQKDAIHPLLPGVIRATADNKLIFRYVCDTKSELMNRIEILRFEEETREFKMSTVHFSRSIPGEKNRVVEDPAECRACHQSKTMNMLKPVWNAYPVWPGMYGSSDDYLNPPFKRAKISEADYPTHIKPEQELSSFRQFAENEKNNPCYQLSLPEKYENLYRFDHRLYHDNRRQPNLRYSENFGLLYAKTLVAQLQKQDLKKYEEKLPELARAAFGCRHNGTVTDPDPTFPLLPYTSTPRKGVNGRLANLLKELGVHDEDFNLSLHGIQDYDFVAGLYGGKASGGKDLTFLSMVRTQIVESLAERIPELKMYYHLSRGVSEYYTLADNSCIDDQGGRIVMKRRDRRRVCRMLESRIAETKPVIVAPTPTPSHPNPTPTPGTVVLDETKLYEQWSKNTGFQFLVNTCSRCHGVGGDSLAPQFLKDPKEFLKRLAAKPAFSARIQKRITSSDAPMPPDHPLNPNEQTLVIDFLTNFKAAPSQD